VVYLKIRGAVYLHEEVPAMATLTPCEAACQSPERVRLAATEWVKRVLGKDATVTTERLSQLVELVMVFCDGLILKAVLYSVDDETECATSLTDVGFLARYLPVAMRAFLVRLRVVDAERVRRLFSEADCRRFLEGIRTLLKQ